MADVKIRVLAEDEATRVFKKLDDSFDNIGKTINSLKQNYWNLRSALSDVGRVAQQAYQLIKEGAALELAEKKFNLLSEAIGTTSDALKTDLRDATHGLLSDADAMSLAGDLMSLGLAKTHDEAVRLTNVAAQLGMNMNQLVLTLTNKTTMRFDALGIAVDGFEEKVKRLEAAGYSADEAFKFAFLEQAEAQLELTGGVLDTTAGKLMQVEASFTNVKNAALSAVVEGLGPLIDAVNENIIRQELQRDALEKGIITYDDITEAVKNTTYWYEQDAAVIDMIKGKTETYDRIVAGIAETHQRHANAVERGAMANGYYAERAREAAQASAEAGAATANAARQQQKLNQELNVSIGAYSTLNTSVIETAESLFKQIEFLQKGGAAVSAMIEASKNAMDAGDLGLAEKMADEAFLGAVDVNLEMGNITADEAAQKIADQFGWSMDESKAKVEELQSTIFAMTQKEYLLNFKINVQGGLPQVGDIYSPSAGTGGKYQTGGGGEEYAVGTGGWMRVPGPVGAPMPITVHGGEMMNVMPVGQSGSGSGGNVIWYGDAIFTSSGEAMDFVAQMQTRASRNAASAAAGGGYIG